jgi:hypothetical protein
MKFVVNEPALIDKVFGFIPTEAIHLGMEEGAAIMPVISIKVASAVGAVPVLAIEVTRYARADLERFGIRFDFTVVGPGTVSN